MNRGFTLIEMVVVVGIIAVVSSVTLTNYAKFGGQILLRNLAYDMALTIRQAQVYGISARTFFDAPFAAGHGVSFDLSVDTTSFRLYTDTNEDAFYSLAGTELIELYTIGRGYRIRQICVSNNSSEYCDATKLDILFKRPEPDAIIRGDRGSGFGRYNRARIIVISPQGSELAVLVEASGQISIQRI
mgnify:CR=1 FL=1|tara:strand:+ start:11300 stop:11860 length:561 start_codon:yes stop_codon:yes gene_type:complete